MIAEAYAYADGGGDQPKEITLGRYINRFGVEAVYGRVMSAKEIRQITLSERVISAYFERKASNDWASWAKENPGANSLLEKGLILNGKCS